MTGLLSLKESFFKPKVWISITLSLVFLITLQNFLLGLKDLNGLYTHYNNYLIFKNSFLHLINNQDLYIAYPKEYWDLFKYTPTFAVFMAPFNYLPDYVGLFLWNSVNALAIIYALFVFPFRNRNAFLYAFGFVLIELITSLQNSQSNGLIAGLTLASFLLIEKRKIAYATLLLSIACFVKPFALAGFAIFIFYPDLLKAIAISAIWFILLFLLPLIFVSFQQLSFLYHSWFHMLAEDHDASFGLSVMGWLHSWFGLNVSKNIVLAVGSVILLLPLFKIKAYKYLNFRELFLASILIWSVIFNHKAESPTFIIAIAGVGLWYYTQKKTMINLILLLFAFIFTVLSPTDLFPPSTHEFFKLYTVKAIPCIFIWIKIQIDLWKPSLVLD